MNKIISVKKYHNFCITFIVINSSEAVGCIGIVLSKSDFVAYLI